MEVPTEITVNQIPVTVTAIYPNDGSMGSVTFDAEGQTARGAVFLVSQNGVTVEDVSEIAVSDAIAAVL